MTENLLPSAEAIQSAAWVLDVERELIEAVAEVERAGRKALDKQRRPVILFEAHLFSRFTGGRYDGSEAPGVRRVGAVISRPRWKPGTYGSYEEQHKRLEFAAQLDRKAALRATSWGLFQILADNWQAAGADSVQDFINRMYAGADSQLRAFTFFIIADRRLLTALRTKNFAAFSEIYNGPGYEKTGHHTKMAAAYKQLLSMRA